jgi:hypothetical protein
MKRQANYWVAKALVADIATMRRQRFGSGRVNFWRCGLFQLNPKSKYDPTSLQGTVP